MLNVQLPSLAPTQSETTASGENTALTLTELAMLVHDLRTPILSVLGFNAIAESESDPKVRKQAHARIDTLSHHLLNIVNDILLTARSEEQGVVLDHIAVSSPRLLADVVAAVQPAADARQIKIKLNMSYDLPLEFMGDPLRLRQVLINLASNAIAFSPEGRSVLIEAGLCLATRAICFSVEDQGPGMSAEEVAMLFRPFRQVRRISGAKGTGLGLAICDRLVRGMGGKIEVKSVKGKGSRFTATLPFCSRMPGSAADVPELPQTAETTHHALEILVVDDNELVNEIVSHVARKAGHRVVSVTSGVAALDHLGRKPCDLVLLDQRMEGLDGLETARRIRTMALEQPPMIIGLTAHLTPDLVALSKDAGMDACFQKTTRPKDLIAMIELALQA